MFANFIIILVAIIVCIASANNIKSLNDLVEKRAFLKRDDYASDHAFHHAILLNNRDQLAHEDLEIRMDENAASSGYLYTLSYSSASCASSTLYSKLLVVPAGK